MRYHLTFSDVISVLIENKKKTYPQYQLVTSLFSQYLDDTLDFADLQQEDIIMYSRWCTGARPIPLEIVRCYEADGHFQDMEQDFRDKIIPNLLNPSHARIMIEELIADSRNVIGSQKVDELLQMQPMESFFTEVIRYAILNDHNHNALYSPDLADTLLNGRLPSPTQEFIGRKKELAEAASLLKKNPVLFVSGIAGIGKSEFAKVYAERNRKKYRNVIFLHYTGSLKKCITDLVFDTDTLEMTESDLFEAHYRILQKLHSDSLVIFDNFNVLPKDDGFFKELVKNDFQILLTTRCRIASYPVLELGELDRESELTELFFRHCPSSRDDTDTVHDLIHVLHGHTLLVCLAALSVNASGIEPDELLYELKHSGLNADIREEIPVYKDEEYSQELLTVHLRKLLQLNHLTELQTDIMRCLSLLPLSGVPKGMFRKWLKLDSLNDVNHLIRYGFIAEDLENKLIRLHPLIQEVAVLETLPTVSRCRILLDSLHLVCLTHGLEVRRPEAVLSSLTNINKQVINDDSEYLLLLLQDEFPYFEKYGMIDYLPELISRIEYIMQEYHIDTPKAKALLLDYKAQIFYIHGDYENALKRRKRALSIMEPLLNNQPDISTPALISNLYNNLGNVYLATGKSAEASEMLRKAMELRLCYFNQDLIATHDTLEQLVNIISLMIQRKDYTQAEQLLNFYENIILEKEGPNCVDYGICLYERGVIALKTANASLAESSLLGAEQIFTDRLGKTADYTRSTYTYLYNVYRIWGKKERELEYKEKYLESKD